jgi:SAM-dependent methyltransferase
MTAYTFDNAATAERDRLTALETVFDPGTRRHLRERGLREGWHCLEVGGGGGSITRWLAETVGVRGSVLVTDLNTRFLDELARPNLTVRRHDITTDQVPEAAFDLVHLRMVLQHLPERRAVLRKPAAALRPGGWLVVEDMDFGAVVADPVVGEREANIFHRLMDGHVRLSANPHFDPDHGRQLLRLLEEMGLRGVDAEGRAFVWRGGSPGATAWRLSIGHLRDRLIGSGVVMETELERGLALLTDAAFLAVSPIMMAAWGQRPAT